MAELIISDKGLVGWREWNFLKPNYLVSKGGQALWLPGEKIAAECEAQVYEIDQDGDIIGTHPKHPDQEAPVMECTCGIYAHTTEEQIYGSSLWGEVYLWGQVKEYETGYRAQYAYPKQLFVTKENEHLIPILMGAYGVPVTLKEKKVRPTRKEKKAFNILNPLVTAKTPTKDQFLEYHPGYKRFYELCAEHQIATRWDDSIGCGMGRSVKVYDTFDDATEHILLKLMKCADRTTLGAGSRMGGYRKPYRFHFLMRFAPFHEWNKFKEVTV